MSWWSTASINCAKGPKSNWSVTRLAQPPPAVLYPEETPVTPSESAADTAHPSVVAVIVAYNRKALLLEALAALRAQTLQPTAVVVIDNHSDDDSAGTAREAWPEIEVVRLVADGRSNKWIGEQLSLSALTVKSHLARIGRKLGTGDRAHMVALAMRAGVIS